MESYRYSLLRAGNPQHRVKRRLRRAATQLRALVGDSRGDATLSVLALTRIPGKTADLKTRLPYWQTPKADGLDYHRLAEEITGLHGVEWVNLGGGGQFQALFDGPK